MFLSICPITGITLVSEQHKQNIDPVDLTCSKEKVRVLCSIFEILRVVGDAEGNQSGSHGVK